MPKKYPIGAGMIVLRDFVDDGNKILLLRNFDGTWDLPKGRLDPGETLWDCAVREMEEEASITDATFPWGDQHISLENLTFFVCKTEQDPRILANPTYGNLEHESAVWVGPYTSLCLLPEFLKPAVEWAIDNMDL